MVAKIENMNRQDPKQTRGSITGFNAGQTCPGAWGTVDRRCPLYKIGLTFLLSVTLRVQGQFPKLYTHFFVVAELKSGY